MAISTIGSNSLNQTSDLTINGQTVGKGGGNVATNTVHGVSALNSNTTGATGVAIGYQAGYTNSTGPHNTFVGTQAGYSSTGGENTCVGRTAGYSISTGTGNTFIGPGNGATSNGAGYFVTTGSKNSILGGYNGNQGGLDIRTSNNHIVLSDGDGNPRLIFNNASPPDALIGCTSNSGVQIATAGGFVCDGSNHLWVTRSGAGGATVDIGRTGSAGTGGYLEWWYNGTNTGVVSTNGSTTTYGTSSDYRLKENVAPMTGALDKVAQFKPVTYKWKTSGLDGEGFIAHELAEVVPEAVFGEKDGTEVYKDDDGNEQTRPKYQSVDTSFLVATLTAAIQELKTIVDAQAAEIAELKAKVA